MTALIVVKACCITQWYMPRCLCVQAVTVVAVTRVGRTQGVTAQQGMLSVCVCLAALVTPTRAVSVRPSRLTRATICSAAPMLRARWSTRHLSVIAQPSFHSETRLHNVMIFLMTFEYLYFPLCQLKRVLLLSLSSIPIIHTVSIHFHYSCHTLITREYNLVHHNGLIPEPIKSIENPDNPQSTFYFLHTLWIIRIFDTLSYSFMIVKIINKCLLFIMKSILISGKRANSNYFPCEGHSCLVQPH